MCHVHLRLICGARRRHWVDTVALGIVAVEGVCHSLWVRSRATAGTLEVVCAAGSGPRHAHTLCCHSLAVAGVTMRGSMVSGAPGRASAGVTLVEVTGGVVRALAVGLLAAARAAAAAVTAAAVRASPAARTAALACKGSRRCSTLPYRSCQSRRSACCHQFSSLPPRSPSRHLPVFCCGSRRTHT